MRLSNLRSYFESMSWFHDGLAISDLIYVLDYLENENQDAKFLTSQWRQVRGLIHYWIGYCKEQKDLLEISCNQTWAKLDPLVRLEIAQEGIAVREAAVKSRIESHPEYTRLSMSRLAYDRLIYTLNGLLDATSESITVQIAVSTRVQEQLDN